MIAAVYARNGSAVEFTPWAPCDDFCRYARAARRVDAGDD
jgi:hypothetical protein